MPNRNYQRGVRFERDLVKLCKKCGLSATRSAGSHGLWDVSAVADYQSLAKALNKHFEWLSTEQPKHPWFDWTVRWNKGKLERMMWVKVLHDPQDRYAYFFQLKCKVKS